MVFGWLVKKKKIKPTGIFQAARHEALFMLVQDMLYEKNLIFSLVQGKNDHKSDAYFSKYH